MFLCVPGAISTQNGVKIPIFGGDAICQGISPPMHCMHYSDVKPTRIAGEVEFALNVGCLDLPSGTAKPSFGQTVNHQEFLSPLHSMHYSDVKPARIARIVVFSRKVGVLVQQRGAARPTFGEHAVCRDFLSLTHYSDMEPATISGNAYAHDSGHMVAVN